MHIYGLYIIEILPDVIAVRQSIRLGIKPWTMMVMSPDISRMGIGGNKIKRILCLRNQFYKHGPHFCYCLYFRYEIKALEIIVEVNIVKTMLRLVV